METFPREGMFWKAICGVALIPNIIRFEAEEMKCTFCPWQGASGVRLGVLSFFGSPVTL
jgi:hypothetical protein